MALAVRSRASPYFLFRNFTFFFCRRANSHLRAVGQVRWFIRSFCWRRQMLTEHLVCVFCLEDAAAIETGERHCPPAPSVHITRDGWCGSLAHRVGSLQFAERERCRGACPRPHGEFGAELRRETPELHVPPPFFSVEGPDRTLHGPGWNAGFTGHGPRSWKQGLAGCWASKLESAEEGALLSNWISCVTLDR